MPFGYEEAIGFMFGPDIRDKDGVAATVCYPLLSTKSLVPPYIGSLRRDCLCAQGQR